MKDKKYFSSGEFAKLTGVNKRTLHYYHDIDLFNPDYISEKGYHYYSVGQFAKLELILVLRKVGLSIEEIKDYFKLNSVDEYREMLENKNRMIDTYIQQLEMIKGFLNQKIKQSDVCLEAKHGLISCVSLPERKIVLSKKISGKYDDDDFSIAANFSKQLKEQFNLYQHFGSRIHVENILNGHFDDYDCYFADGSNEYYDEILPSGDYIEAFCIGSWDLLVGIYEKIIDYASKQGLRLVGYAYEEGMNEMMIDDMNEYITRILIKVEKNRS